MKKKTMKEVSFCDYCGKEVEYPHRCMGCGTEYCYECSKIYLVEYHAGVYFQGSGDGDFCHMCNLNPPGKVKLLHQMYKGIEKLRNEVETFNREFDTQRKIQEDELMNEYKRVTGD